MVENLEVFIQYWYISPLFDSDCRTLAAISDMTKLRITGLLSGEKVW